MPIPSSVTVTTISESFSVVVIRIVLLAYFKALLSRLLIILVKASSSMTMLSFSGIEEVSIVTFFCLADNSKIQVTLQIISLIR